MTTIQVKRRKQTQLISQNLNWHWPINSSSFLDGLGIRIDARGEKGKDGTHLVHFKSVAYCNRALVIFHSVVLRSY